MHATLPMKRMALLALATLALILAGGFRYPYDALVVVLSLVAGAAAAVLLAGWGIQSAWRQRSKGPSTFIPLIVVVLGAVGCWFTAWLGYRTVDALSERSFFAVNKPRYHAIVASVMQRQWSPGIHRGVVEGEYANLDVSDSVRVELSSDGYFGNWEGVYFDPTDRYALRKSNDFEGTVYGCRRIEGHYYFCRYDMEKF